MFFCLKIIKICLSRTVFWTKGHKDKRGYGNRMFGRNKSYVLLSKNNKNLSVKELLFFDIRTQGQKGI